MCVVSNISVCHGIALRTFPVNGHRRHNTFCHRSSSHLSCQVSRIGSFFNLLLSFTFTCVRSIWQTTSHQSLRNLCCLFFFFYFSAVSLTVTDDTAYHIHRLDTYSLLVFSFFRSFSIHPVNWDGENTLHHIHHWDTYSHFCFSFSFFYALIGLTDMKTSHSLPYDAYSRFYSIFVIVSFPCPEVP